MRRTVTVLDLTKRGTAVRVLGVRAYRPAAVPRYRRGVFATYSRWERAAMVGVVAAGLGVLAAIMAGWWPR